MSPTASVNCSNDVTHCVWPGSVPVADALSAEKKLTSALWVTMIDATGIDTRPTPSFASSGIGTSSVFMPDTASMRLTDSGPRTSFTARTMSARVRMPSMNARSAPLWRYRFERRIASSSPSGANAWVRACADVRDRLDPDFVVNARTDAFAVLGADEAIRRCNLYLESGADLAFIDGIRTRADIARAVREVKGPLSVNLMDAVSGMKTELVPIPELARMGVGRVSIPVASIMVAHRALKSFFTALKASPTGTLAGQAQWVTTFEEYTKAVGLEQYRELEERYLPHERMETKYHGVEKIVG